MNLSEIRGEGSTRTKGTTARPRIGITMFSGREGHKFYTKLQYNYVQSIYNAGGVPLLIPTLSNLDQSLAFAATIDGLMLTGGEDLNPLTYGAEPRVELGVTDLDRDRWELSLLRACEERDLPILGVCRGLQAMNVHRGGTLFQDISAETESSLGHAPYQNPMESLHHTIDLESGSRLQEIFGRSHLVVNSFHHQAVRDLGRDLVMSAVAADGIIEGAEDPARHFFLGVQFHAEALPPIDSYYLRLFSALVAAAKDHST